MLSRISWVKYMHSFDIWSDTVQLLLILQICRMNLLHVVHHFVVLLSGQALNHLLLSLNKIAAMMMLLSWRRAMSYWLAQRAQARYVEFWFYEQKYSVALFICFLFSSRILDLSIVVGRDIYLCLMVVHHSDLSFFPWLKNRKDIACKNTCSGCESTFCHSWCNFINTGRFEVWYSVNAWFFLTAC